MTSSNTQASSALDAALQGIPKKFRSRILTAYLELKSRYARATYDGEWDTGGLSAGKFCEAVIRFLQKQLTGDNTRFGIHIQNFPDECRKLIQVDKTKGSESLRIIIPRALAFLYTLRGKRGIGHVGGDVEANAIDAVTIIRNCDWIVCELIRSFHSLSLEHAQEIVDSVASRQAPQVWSVGGKKRVLDRKLNYKQQTLLLLYSEPHSGVLAEDLFDWTGHSNQSVYRRDVLRPLHGDRLIEYDEIEGIVHVSPTGEAVVEREILPALRR